MLDISNSDEFQMDSSSISGSDKSDLFGEKSFGPHQMICNPTRESSIASSVQKNKSRNGQTNLNAEDLNE